MHQKLSPYYALNLNIKVQGGYNRSAIYNLESGQLWFIDNKWESVLNEYQFIDTKKILNSRLDISEREMTEFFSYLIKEKVLKIEKDPQKQIEPTFILPTSSSWKLRKLHVEFAPNFENKLIETLARYPTRHLTITFDRIDENSFSLIRRISEEMVESMSIIIDPIIIEEDLLFELVRQNGMIETIFIDKESPILPQRNGFCEFKHKPDSVDIYNPEIKITKETFQLTAKNHAYFHKSVFISAAGDIKQDQTAKKVFGNFLMDDLEEIIFTDEFKALWYVSKRKVDVCNHCEFARACIDRRPLTRRANDTWYSSIECTYNPYISKGKDDDNYLSLAECGIYSTPRSFRIEIGAYLAAKAHIIGKEHRARNPYKGI